MKKFTKKLIKYYFPSLFFASEATEEYRGNNPMPSILPRNCFGFRFGEQEVVQDGETEFTRPIKWDTTFYVIGVIVPFNEIADIPENSILRSNLSSEGKGIRTHLGTWQHFSPTTTVLPKTDFAWENRWI
jgi:hypothetical protein